MHDIVENSHNTSSGTSYIDMDALGYVIPDNAGKKVRGKVEELGIQTRA